MCHLLSSSKYHANYRLDCPNNYSTNYRRSQINKIIDFELRLSDINEQIDIAYVNNDLFLCLDFRLLLSINIIFFIVFKTIK